MMLRGLFRADNILVKHPKIIPKTLFMCAFGIIALFRETKGR